MKRTDTDKETRIMFASTTDMAEYCRQPLASPYASNPHSTAQREDAWDHGVGYDGAVQMLEHGDPELAKGLARPMIGSPQPNRRQPYTCVAGQRVNVQAYVSGSPEAFYAIQGAVRNPLVRIAVGNSSPFHIDAKVKVTYGRAIVALVDSVEGMGYNVELTILGVVESSDGRRWTIGTVVKPHGRHVDLGRLGYAIAHPAYLRRNIFRVKEIADTKGELRGYYGLCRPVPGDYVKGLGYDLYVPAVGVRDGGVDVDKLESPQGPALALAYVTGLWEGRAS